MATALPLPDRISPESTRQAIFRDITAQFGDGYIQSAADGLNSKTDRWNIIWNNVSESEKDTIVNALNFEGSWGVLTWRPFDEAAQKKWRLEKPGYNIRYGATASGRRRYVIDCVLVQRFDL